MPALSHVHITAPAATAGRLSAGSPRGLQYNLLDNGAATRLAPARLHRAADPALCTGADAPTAGARFPSSKLKLDELFLGWLSLPESQKLVRRAARAPRRGPRTCGARSRFVTRAAPRQVLALLDDAKAGRPIGGPTATRAPLSPSAAASLHTASTAMVRDPRPTPLPGRASPPFRAIQRASCGACASAPHPAPLSRGALAGPRITPTDASRVHARRSRRCRRRRAAGTGIRCWTPGARQCRRAAEVLPCSP